MRINFIRLSAEVQWLEISPQFAATVNELMCLETQTPAPGQAAPLRGRHDNNPLPSASNKGTRSVFVRSGYTWTSAMQCELCFKQMLAAPCIIRHFSPTNKVKVLN
jgi:hypothetical protein